MASSNQTRFFTSILHPYQSAALRSARAIKRKRKRNRNEDLDQADASATEDDTTDAPNTEETPNAAKRQFDPFFYPFDTSELRRATVEVDDEEQAAAAGLEADDLIPSAPFPHSSCAAVGVLEYLPTASHLISALASLKPPIFVSGDKRNPAGPIHKSPPTSLRAHHLGVLTTLLLRCVQEGDWMRAGRAWASLIRTWHQEFVDVRTNGFWGLGAEILLQRTKEVVYPPNPKVSKARPKGRTKRVNDMSEDEDQDESESDVSSENSSDRDREDDARSSSELQSSPGPEEERPSGPPQRFFTAAGFRQARAYYDRLIVQHPQLHASQRGTLSLDFYPAMLSLWVYEVTELSRRRKWEIHHPARPRQGDAANGLYGGYPNGIEASEDESSDAASDDSETRTRRREQRRASQLAEAAAEELSGARLIASRLDELLLSPPCDTNAYLLELRGHVGVWLSDLVVDSIPPPSSSASMSEDIDEELHDPEMADARKDARQQQLEEVENAREYFLRAQEAGGLLAATATEIIERPIQDYVTTDGTSDDGSANGDDTNDMDIDE